MKKTLLTAIAVSVILVSLVVGMQTAAGFYPTTTPPSMIVESPSNLTVKGQTVSLNFTI